MMPRQLLTEAKLFSQYLTDQDPPRALEERYARASEYLLGAEQDRVVAFVLEHPWSLPYLDAASALFNRHSLLRRKLLIMEAIIETTTEHVDLFVAPTVPATTALLDLARLGCSTAWHAALGMLLYPLTEWL